MNSSRHDAAAANVRRLAPALLAAALTACATNPSQPVAEKLDPVTGTTLIGLGVPLELVTERNRGRGRDPFAFLAPFQIDRMGNRQAFLWVSVPEDNGGAVAVQVLCDAQPLAIESIHLDLKQLQLSRPPYERSAPWSGERYYELPADVLHCLAATRHLTVSSRLADGTEDRFTADPKELKSLAAFAARSTTP